MISLLPVSAFGGVSGAVVVAGAVVVVVGVVVPELKTPPPTKPLPRLGVGAVVVVVDGVVGLKDGSKEVTEGFSGADGAVGTTGCATGFGRAATCVDVGCVLGRSGALTFKVERREPLELEELLERVVLEAEANWVARFAPP